MTRKVFGPNSIHQRISSRIKTRIDCAPAPCMKLIFYQNSKTWQRSEGGACRGEGCARARATDSGNKPKDLFFFSHLFLHFSQFFNFLRSIWRSDEPNRLWLRRHRLIWSLVSAHYNKFQHAVHSSCKRLSDCFWLIAWVHCGQAARDARGRVVAAEGEHRASRALRHAAEVTCTWLEMNRWWKIQRCQNGTFVQITWNNSLW